jgi:DNA-binding transcriptional LysR family regulator
MTASGLGASIMPAAYASASDDKSLVVRALTAPRVSRDISMVTRRGRSLSPACERFIEVMRKELRG